MVTQSPRVHREECGPLRSILGILCVGWNEYLHSLEQYNVLLNQGKAEGGVLFFVVAYGVLGGSVAFVIGTSD